MLYVVSASSYFLFEYFLLGGGGVSETGASEQDNISGFSPRLFLWRTLLGDVL